MDGIREMVRDIDAGRANLFTSVMTKTEVFHTLTTQWARDECTRFFQRSNVSFVAQDERISDKSSEIREFYSGKKITLDAGDCVHLATAIIYKAMRACFFDPDSHEVYLAFAQHWGFTPLPTQPRSPQENGKQERSGGYVKGNALKGRTFDSLDAHNAFLRHWNRAVARLRIHGTTRRQVWTHFVEVEQRALQPLASAAFPFFTAGERTVHTDGHVEVGGAFYPVPLVFLGQRLRVQWDTHLVRVFHVDTLVVVHARVPAGVFAPRAGEAEASTRQQAFVDRLVGQCERDDWQELSPPPTCEYDRRLRPWTLPAPWTLRTRPPRLGNRCRDSHKRPPPSLFPAGIEDEERPALARGRGVRRYSDRLPRGRFSNVPQWPHSNVR
ncbi:MAG: Mu transposase domain-containing protein [Vicinamibacterales bacterium]